METPTQAEIYSNEFERIAYIFREFRITRFCRSGFGLSGEYFLDDWYFADLRELPHVQFLIRKLYFKLRGQSAGDHKMENAPGYRLLFLWILEEIRQGVKDGKISGSQRYSILFVFQNIMGFTRMNLMARVLYYLYPPPGPLFVQKEDPEDLSALADARDLYPSEYWITSLRYTANVILTVEKFNRFHSIWKEAFDRISDGCYGREESLTSLRNFSELLSLHPVLMGMLDDVPWPHKVDSTVVSSSSILAETDDGTKRKKMINNSLLPEFGLEMVAEELPYSSPEKSDSEKMKEYEMFMKSDNAPKEMQDIPMEELDEIAKRKDKAFNKFIKRIKLEPKQILRYQRGGLPLWVSSENVPTEKDIPNCSCGSKRIFEFQIMPQLLNHIELDSVQILSDGKYELQSSIDWGTLAVYTCSELCHRGTENYVEEFIWKQDISKDNLE